MSKPFRVHGETTSSKGPTIGAVGDDSPLDGAYEGPIDESLQEQRPSNQKAKPWPALTEKKPFSLR